VIEEELIAFPIYLFDDLVRLGKQGLDAMNLYILYCRVAKDQRTNQPYCNSHYCKARLRWTDNKFWKADKILKNLGLIIKIKKNLKGGTKHFVKVNHLIRGETIRSLLDKSTTIEIEEDGNMRYNTLNTKYNALNTSNNALSCSCSEQRKLLIKDIEKKTKEKSKAYLKDKNHFTIKDIYNHFVEEMKERDIRISPIATSKELIMIKGLRGVLDKCGISSKKYVSDVIDKWAEIRRLIVWEDSKKSRLMEEPSILEMCISREAILNALELLDKVEDVKVLTKIEDVPKDHPDYAVIVKMINEGVEVKI